MVIKKKEKSYDENRIRMRKEIVRSKQYVKAQVGSQKHTHIIQTSTIKNTLSIRIKPNYDNYQNERTNQISSIK